MTAAECRFCLEKDEITNLISPCSCKGTFKYVHSGCLMNWFYHQPERATRCSVCLESFERRDNRSLEELPILTSYISVKLKSPFTVIIASHCSAVSIIYSDLSLIALKLNTIHAYILYQLFNHIITLYYLSMLVYKIKNKRMYCAYWLCMPRMFLFFLHAYLLFTIPLTAWVGGFAADYCLCLYFYEHFEIINAINRKHTFQFISRED